MARNAGLDNDTLHDLVYGATGEAHISKLSVDEAGKVIEALDRLMEAGRPGRLSTEQRKKILKLMFLLGWERRQVNGLCRRVTKVGAFEWLDSRGAWKLIEAMKAMKDRQPRMDTNEHE